MSESRVHRLDGLEPDNLLAFLALLGLLRALEAARPAWHPRAAWDLDCPPLRPVLTLSCPVSERAICEAAIEGLAFFRKALLPFSWPRRNNRATRTSVCSEVDRYRYVARRLIRTILDAKGRYDPDKLAPWLFRLELLEVAGAEYQDRNGDNLETTPLKLPSGQMSFIGAMFETVKVCRAGDVEDSLFGPWEFRSRGDSLRLAHQDARRYAYRAKDPSPEGARSERGATALGAFGLLAFKVVPRARATAMISYNGRRREGTVRWPLWKADGASYAAIICMLGNLVGEFDKGSRKLPADVVAIVEARRFVLDLNQGDYGNVSRGNLIWLRRDEKSRK